jgi:DNA gyrase/topoisomerase IV subunit A
MSIEIPLEIGDIIKIGKFKNKRVEVKDISIDEYGLPMVNGKGIMKIRIEKLMKTGNQKIVGGNKVIKEKIEKYLNESTIAKTLDDLIKNKEYVYIVKAKFKDEYYYIAAKLTGNSYLQIEEYSLIDGKFIFVSSDNSMNSKNDKGWIPFNKKDIPSTIEYYVAQNRTIPMKIEKIIKK